jgi:hypothetical protein
MFAKITINDLIIIQIMINKGNNLLQIPTSYKTTEKCNKNA